MTRIPYLYIVGEFNNIEDTFLLVLGLLNEILHSKYNPITLKRLILRILPQRVESGVKRK